MAGVGWLHAAKHDTLQTWFVCQSSSIFYESMSDLKLGHVLGSLCGWRCGSLSTHLEQKRCTTAAATPAQGEMSRPSAMWGRFPQARFPGSGSDAETQRNRSPLHSLQLPYPIRRRHLGRCQPRSWSEHFAPFAGFCGALKSHWFRNNCRLTDS